MADYVQSRPKRGSNSTTAVSISYSAKKETERSGVDINVGLLAISHFGSPNGVAKFGESSGHKHMHVSGEHVPGYITSRVSKRVVVAGVGGLRRAVV